jgi:glutamate carboxypeptidase
VDPILAHVRTLQPEIVSLIRQFVECESPSDDPAAVNRFVDLVAETVSPFAAVKTVRGGQFGKHLVCRMHLAGHRKTGQVLALGHSDTVWPAGTLRTMPFREADGRLWGPGTLDMKAGIAFFCFAVRALRDLDIPAPSHVLLQLNSDEEVGSPSSRALTEANAARSKAVLVLEPGTGLSGKLKTARKGVGDFTVTVRGRAAHAGVDFSAGASAVLELAHQITSIAGFTDLARGITVNPGVISGGSRSNVVAAEATPGKEIPLAPARRQTVHPHGGRRFEPAAAGALPRDRELVPRGSETGARPGSRTGGIVHRRRFGRQLQRRSGDSDARRHRRGGRGRARRP